MINWNNRYKYGLKLVSLLFFFVLSIYGISQQYISPIYSWYSTSWVYRRGVTVTNPGSTLSNEDVLVIVDTATEISGGRMQSDCDDIRFIDKADDTTVYSYWIEGGCNTTTTQIWVRVPSVPTGTNEIMYMYFGNSLATAGTQTWTGNIMLYADTTCPSGWTRATQFDDKFMYGSTTYGTTGGSSSHGHGTVSGTSTSIIDTSVSGLSGTTTGASSSHTHTTLQGSVDTESSVYPSYLDMIVCYNNIFTIPSGLISMFDVTAPTGWTRFSALDSKFPKGNSSYGVSGGSDTHDHSLTTGVTTGAGSATQDSFVPVSASGGTEINSGDYKIHKFTVGSSSLSVTSGGNVEVLVVAGGGGGGMTDYTTQYQGGFGGGGAGGHINNTSFAVSSGSISLSVGAGGAGNVDGSNSTFSTITAIGGGKGDAGAGDNGGCGAGGSNGLPSNRTYGGTGSQGGDGGDSVCSICGNATAGGGGGGGGGDGSNSSDYYGGAGGAGAYYLIAANAGVGESGYIAGGGGGGGWYEGGNGGVGGGGNGGDNDPEAPTAGTDETGSGGGGGVEAGYNGRAGGDGVILVKYLSTSTGSIASSSHTHTSSGGSVSSESNLPPYLSMIYAKANSSIYVTDDNVVMASSIPPYGWSRFTPLDSKFARGSDTYGGTGGSSTHTHDVTINTGVPSATVSYYGTSGNSFASDSHYHSVTVTSSSASSIPPYYSVINIQRKTSLTTDVGTTDSFNTAPYAPSSILIEGVASPTRVTDLTPEFSAVFSDIDTSDTGNYYQIEVNSNNTFTGTVMWDSGLQSITPITNGARSIDISYNGTTLSTNGTTYYVRMKFADNYGFVSDWSSTSQFQMNTTPNAPSSLYAEGSSNPAKVSDLTPEFSAIFSDSDSTDTGVSYEIEVNTNSSFTGTVMWDSDKVSITAITNGARSTDISYGSVGTPVTLTLNGVTYYWRIRFWDNNDSVSEWSSTANFTMSGAPTAPTELLTDGMENPTMINSQTPKFSAIYHDPNGDSSGSVEIEVNSNSSFTGTVMWDSGKVTSVVVNNTRSADYTYAGTQLTGISGTVYYWRIRFWDSDDNQGEWSPTAQFTDQSVHLYLDGLQLDGLQID